MANDLGNHKRWNRKSRHLIKLLSKTRVKSVRLKIIEELQHEIERAKQSRLGQAAKRGAIGVSGWGKRVYAKGEAYAKSPARRNHTRSSVGAAARKAAIEREKTRPAREKAKLARKQQRDAARMARQQQRETRRTQRARQGNGVRARITASRAGRNGQMANGRNGTITRTSSPRKPAAPARPAAGARASRAAQGSSTAAKPARTAPAAEPARTAPAAKPARPARTSRTSKTG